MGYDYPECIICYCRDGFNEYAEQNYTICKCCLSELTPLRGRAHYYADSVSQKKISCVKCKHECPGYIDIPICDDHAKELK